MTKVLNKPRVLTNSIISKSWFYLASHLNLSMYKND